MTQVTIFAEFQGEKSIDDIRYALNQVEGDGWMLGDSDGYSLDEDSIEFDGEFTILNATIPIMVTDYSITSEDVESCFDACGIGSCCDDIKQRQNVYEMFSEQIGF